MDAYQIMPSCDYAGSMVPDAVDSAFRMARIAADRLLYASPSDGSLQPRPAHVMDEDAQRIFLYLFDENDKRTVGRRLDRIARANQRRDYHTNVDTDIVCDS